MITSSKLYKIIKVLFYFSVITIILGSIFFTSSKTFAQSEEVLPETFIIHLVGLDDVPDPCIKFSWELECIPVTDGQEIVLEYIPGNYIGPMLEFNMVDDDGNTWFYILLGDYQEFIGKEEPTHVYFGGDFSLVAGVEEPPYQFGDSILATKVIVDYPYDQLLEWVYVIDHLTGYYSKPIPVYTFKYTEDSINYEIDCEIPADNANSGIWAFCPFTIPADGPAGNWTLQVSYNTGPFRGNLSGSIDFTVVDPTEINTEEETFIVNLEDLDDVTNLCIRFSGELPCIQVTDGQEIVLEYIPGNIIGPVLNFEKVDDDGNTWSYAILGDYQEFIGNIKTDPTVISFGGDFTLTPWAGESPFQFNENKIAAKEIRDGNDHYLEWVSLTDHITGQYSKPIPNYSFTNSDHGIDNPITCIVPESEIMKGVWAICPFTIPVDGPAGKWTLQVSYDTGPFRGTLEGEYNFFVADLDHDGIWDEIDNAPNNYNPDQRDVDDDGQADVIDPCPSDPTDSCNINGSIASSIGTAGGSLTTPDGQVDLVVPESALTVDTSLSITASGSDYLVDVSQDTLEVLNSYTLQPHGATFNTPITLTFHWGDYDNNGVVDDTTLLEKDLVIIKNGEIITPACEVNPNCDMGSNVLTIQVNSFSLFELSGFINRAPVLDGINGLNSPTQLGTMVNISANFTDPDINDTFTATWDWGNGQSSAGSISNRIISGNFIYNTPGVYTVTLVINDQFGASDSMTFQYIVIYDPEGGFVTGGGWITSPEGAYLQDPSMSGKASFGFTSQYKNGANLPTGNTEFHFQTADFIFSSTSYDWLVVAGSKAQFKGTGTINGSGSYGFMLTAVDGNPDRFRIKIWNKSTSAIIYDNMLGVSDDENLLTSIGGGSIVLHK